MTKLVFHLGDMKTGSTAIQSALSAKRWACGSVKLIYPSSNRTSHISFAQSMLEGADDPRTKKLAREITTEIESHPDADCAVISAEQFENVNPQVLKQVIETHMPGYLAEARFIAYVRPYAERIPSTYAERIKTGKYVGTLTELHNFLSRRDEFIYTPRFVSWRETFGAAFELRPMIRDRLFRQDVVADFLQFALQTDDFSLSDTPDANQSLSLENLAIVRQMHIRLNGGKHKGEAYQGTVGRALARRMNESPFGTGTKLALHRALAEQFRSHYAADAAALDAAFFTGTPMTDALNAAPAKAVEAEQSMRIEDLFTAREQYLIDLFLDQTCTLIKANPAAVADQLRADHSALVIAPEAEAETAAAPKRRRAGKGAKPAPRAAGKARAGKRPGARARAAATTAE